MSVPLRSSLKQTFQSGRFDFSVMKTREPALVRLDFGGEAAGLVRAVAEGPLLRFVAAAESIRLFPGEVVFIAFVVAQLGGTLNKQGAMQAGGDANFSHGRPSTSSDMRHPASDGRAGRDNKNMIDYGLAVAAGGAG